MADDVAELEVKDGTGQNNDRLRRQRLRYRQLMTKQVRMVVLVVLVEQLREMRNQIDIPRNNHRLPRFRVGVSA